METVLRIALSNAAVATAAAIVAWVAGRWIKRPALTHALWLLVLAKLVTPPIWTAHVGWPTERMAPHSSPHVMPADDPLPSSTRMRPPAVQFVRNTRHVDNVSATALGNQTMAMAAPMPAGSGSFFQADQAPFPATETNTIDGASDVEGALADRSGAVSDMPATSMQLNASETSETLPASSAVSSVPLIGSKSSAIRFARLQSLARRWLYPLAGIVWLAGSVVFAIVAIGRIFSFRRMLRHTRPASRELHERVRRLARRMGMRSAPGVWLMPGAVSPMIWSGSGWARLLVPVVLWERLEELQRDTLLSHELAHLARRDHWVRWLELAATVLYWWNPVCWWARRELREAEEQCCDAWVLWAIPGAFKHYASALLEAVEFLSARGVSGAGPAFPGARSAVPMLASRMGQFGHLKRRLTMLKQGDVSRALSWSAFSAVCGLGCLVLPLTPTFGQSAPAAAEQTTATTTERKSDTSAQESKTETTTESKSAETAPVAVTEKTTAESSSAAETAPIATTTEKTADAPAAEQPVVVTTTVREAVTENSQPVTVRVETATVAPATPSSALPGLAPAQPEAPNAPAALPTAPTPAPEVNDNDPRGRDRAIRRELDAARRQADQQRNRASVYLRNGQDWQGMNPKLMAELDRAKREVEVMSQQLAAAQARLAAMQKMFADQQDMRIKEGQARQGKGEATDAYRNDFQAAYRAKLGMEQGDNREQRIAAVEEQLTRLLKEVHELRGENSPKAPPLAPTPLGR